MARESRSSYKNRERAVVHGVCTLHLRAQMHLDRRPRGAEPLLLQCRYAKKTAQTCVDVRHDLRRPLASDGGAPVLECMSSSPPSLPPTTPRGVEGDLIRGVVGASP